MFTAKDAVTWLEVTAKSDLGRVDEDESALHDLEFNKPNSQAPEVPRNFSIGPGERELITTWLAIRKKTTKIENEISVSDTF